MYFLKLHRIGINLLYIAHINITKMCQLKKTVIVYALYTIYYIQYRRYKQNISLVETSFTLNRMTGKLLFLIMKYTTGFKKCFIISEY